MSQNPWVAILKGGGAMTGTLILILYGLSAYFYRDMNNMLEYFFGTVFFAGIYMLILSAVVHMHIHRKETAAGSIALNVVSAGTYINRQAVVGSNEVRMEGKYERGVRESAFVIYGYLTGILCFFIGMFGVVSLIS